MLFLRGLLLHVANNVYALCMIGLLRGIFLKGNLHKRYHGKGELNLGLGRGKCPSLITGNIRFFHAPVKSTVAIITT